MITGSQLQTDAACMPQLLVMKQQVLKDFPDHDYYLWLDGDAAIIDHNLDMRLIPEAVPGESCCCGPQPVHRIRRVRLAATL